MTLPGWPPRDWRAFLALVALVAGAAVSTGFAAWIVWIVWKGGWHGLEEQRLDILGKALFVALFTILCDRVSLGMAINRRSIKASIPGASFEAEGGDDDAPAATVTTTTTVAAAKPPEASQ